MQHSIYSEGFGVRLRPVQIGDAPFIVWLRNLSHVKGKVGDSAADVSNQEVWLENYFKREGDYYFIVETPLGIPVGTYGLYNIKGDTAESGRWIIRPEVPAAVPSGIVLFDIAFKTLGLRELLGRTVSTNRQVLSINRKFGFRQTRIESGVQIIGGKAVDLVCFILTSQDWLKTRNGLLPFARIAEVQIRDWEQNERCEKVRA